LSEKVKKKANEHLKRYLGGQRNHPPLHLEQVLPYFSHKAQKLPGEARTGPF
jgi:hypothetical protein